MCSIHLQREARARGQRLKRPTVTSRKAAMTDTGTIITITAPDGTVAMIDVDTHRDHKGLVIAVRARQDGSPPGDADLSVHVDDHADACRVFRDSSTEARCDCGAERVPDGFRFRPTGPTVRP